jgi:hypothetical protein
LIKIVHLLHFKIIIINVVSTKLLNLEKQKKNKY